MKWFLVKYIYQILSGTSSSSAQFDEQLRLLLALNSYEALKKAEEMANSFQPPFTNCMGDEVRWKFLCVADLHEIQIPEDGIEVASILHEPNDVPAFLNAVEQRRVFLQKHIECEQEFIGFL